jgi:hypothetical protein
MWDGFPLHFKNEQAREQERQNQQWLCQNPPSHLGIKTDELAKSQKWNGKVKSAKCKACES